MEILKIQQSKWPVPAAYRDPAGDDCILVFCERQSKGTEPQPFRTKPMSFARASSVANRLTVKFDCVVAALTDGILDSYPEPPWADRMCRELLIRPFVRPLTPYQALRKGCYIN